MRAFTLTVVAAAFLLPISAYAADQLSAQERYQAVKEQTKYSGSVGFDKQHKAYRDYVLEARRNDASGMADIAPAAGEEQSQGSPQSQEKKIHNK